MSSSSGAFWSKDLFEGSLAQSLARFWAWEKRELLALFPPKAIAWLLDRGERRLILRQESGALAWTDEAGALAFPIAADEMLASSLTEALARRGVARSAAKIILELPTRAFFVRRFDIPLAAQANLDKLLLSEVERKTPFKAADVLCGHSIAPAPGHADKLAVEQWILRRDLLASALEGSGVALDDLDIVRPACAPGAPPPPDLAVGRRVEGRDMFRIAALGLLALALVLFLLGLGVIVMRQGETAGGLESALAEASARAAKVRQTADRASAESRLLASLRRQRQRIPTLADMWEEISRLLPDGAYVSELRLTELRPDELVVDIVGFSDQAVGLPALFNRATLFKDGALTAPIMPDPQQKREGFSLQAKVRLKSGAAE